MTDHATLQAAIDALGLKVSSVFVPFSQSRNKDEKRNSLNWRVTLYTLSPLDGQRCDILTTDYSAGEAHCPSYTASVRTLGSANSLMRSEAIAFECEHGHAANVMVAIGHTSKGKPLTPEAHDVLYSLISDADVLNYSSFEDWAGSLGYDTDSRAAEKIYQACMSIALKLRSAIGDAGLQALQTSFQDY